MKSKFALSFGIALIIVGLLNIIWPVNNVILLGLSISSLAFSVINLFINDNSDYEYMLYVLPFVILLSFCCFENSLISNNIVNGILSSNINSLLTFISFGFLFFSEYRNHQRESKMNREKTKDFINKNIDFIDEILDSFDKIRLGKEDDINSALLLKLIKDVVDKYQNEIANMRVQTNLLALNKDDFSIYDVNNALSKSRKKLSKR